MKALLFRVALFLMTPTLSLASSPRESLPGTLCAAVVDTTGNYVPAPKLYVYGEESKQSYELEGSQGLVSISLPPGHYRVYSAMSRRQGDFVQRYISHEAHVRVSGGEDSSVILKIGDTAPPRVYLSEAARKKIGLAPELAHYLN